MDKPLPLKDYDCYHLSVKKLIFISLILAVGYCAFFPFLTQKMRIFELLFFNGICAAFLIVILQILSTRLCKIPWFLTITMTSITLSFNIVLLVLIPVTVDRSISTFMLYTLLKEEHLTEQEIQSLVVCEYIYRQNAVAKRLNEQEIMGNIVRNSNNTFTLSAGGSLTIKLMLAIASKFGVLPQRFNSKIADSKSALKDMINFCEKVE